MIPLRSLVIYRVQKWKVKIISIDSDKELANAFPGSTDKEPKSEQTNEQRNENSNETKLCIQCKYLIKLNLIFVLTMEIKFFKFFSR